MLPSNELRAILNHVVGRYIRLEDCTCKQRAHVDILVRKRLTGMPLAKIIGYKEFWKHRFITTQDTLDPRPDSETLIEIVLKICPPTGFSDVTDSSASRVEFVDTGIQNAALDPDSTTCGLVREPSSVKSYRILDLGTGTGCLLISLLSEYPDATGIGVDISERALMVAKQNSIALNLSPLANKDSRVTWIQSNWCEQLSGSFDIIISNPPYIDPSEPINEGATFDPPLALYGGVHIYETILKSIDHHLEIRPKHLFFEIGYTQATAVSSLLQDYGYQNIEIFKDLSGQDRIIHAGPTHEVTTSKFRELVC